MTAACSFCTINCGVDLGRKIAYQVEAWKLASPCSCADASAGKLGERSFVRIASAFSAWLSICGIATVPEKHA